MNEYMIWRKLCICCFVEDDWMQKAGDSQGMQTSMLYYAVLQLEDIMWRFNDIILNAKPELSDIVGWKVPHNRQADRQMDSILE